MRTSLAALSAAVFCAVLLAACGSSSSDSTTKTATVPAGKLGSSNLIHEGSYTGSETDGGKRSVRFSYSTENQLTNFRIDRRVVIARHALNNGVGFRVFTSPTYGVYTGSWQTETKVVGTIEQKNANGKVVRTIWEANAVAH